MKLFKQRYDFWPHIWACGGIIGVKCAVLLNRWWWGLYWEIVWHLGSLLLSMCWLVLNRMEMKMNGELLSSCRKRWIPCAWGAGGLQVASWKVKEMKPKLGHKRKFLFCCPKGVLPLALQPQQPCAARVNFRLFALFLIAQYLYPGGNFAAELLFF